ncbi:MAG: glutamate-5-semialdehyde dehydrogenase, partial [Nitrospinae bacterium]|nr:glutamate-5-semialdehyde dehydrogenase [Nitrospinota bacterium]
MTEKNPWDAYVSAKAEEAKRTSRSLAALSTAVKDAALLAMAQALVDQTKVLLEANAEDLVGAEEKGLTKAMIDRLTLTEARVEEMARGLSEVAALPDPVGEVLGTWRRPNGLEVGRVRVPLGVIGIIYESRPNVTSDTAGLCLKSGNAVILRGGSEAIHSNAAIAGVIKQAAAEAGIPAGAIQFLEETDRAVVSAMLKLDKLIDVIIPRGGEGLVRAVTEASTIPVLKHDKGLVHIYIDVEAGGKRYREMHVDGGVTTEVFFLYGLFRDFRSALRETGLDPLKVRLKLYIVRNGKIQPKWQWVKDRVFPIAERSLENLLRMHAIGDLYRLYAITEARGGDFNLAYIPDNYVPVPKETFDPVEMNRLFNLGFKEAVG